jgi:hypothetical protein
LYLNDLEICFGENNVNGVESISAKCLEQLGFYIKIFIILYADDTVIMSETEEGIQPLLCELELDFDPLFLKIGINIPFPQLSDIIPLSNIILNNNT